MSEPIVETGPIIHKAVREEMFLDAVNGVTMHMQCLTTGTVGDLPNGLGMKLDRAARAAHFMVLARAKSAGTETRRDLLNQQVLELFAANDQASIELQLEKLAAGVLDWLIDLRLAKSAGS